MIRTVGIIAWLIAASSVSFGQSPATAKDHAAPVEIDTVLVVAERKVFVSRLISVTAAVPVNLPPSRNLVEPDQPLVANSALWASILELAQKRETAMVLPGPKIVAKVNTPATGSTTIEVPLQVDGPPNVDRVVFRKLSLTIEVTPRVESGGTRLELSIETKDPHPEQDIDDMVVSSRHSVSVPDGDSVAVGGWSVPGDSSGGLAFMIVLTPRQ